MSDTCWPSDAAGTLLLDALFSPRVRSAAYRLFAGLPGLREIGPATGRLLATQTVAARSGRIGPRDRVRNAGDVLDYRAALDSRWTDRPPARHQALTRDATATTRSPLTRSDTRGDLYRPR